MAEKKGKAKGGSKRWKLYQISEGKLARKNKFCPKCGAGFFLAEHSNRLYCGCCGYTEMKDKK